MNSREPVDIRRAPTGRKRSAVVPVLLRVLVLEERGKASSWQTVLQKAGYLVMPACNSTEAVAWLRGPGKPDAVLLDYGIGGSDVLELCRAIRRTPETKNIPLIILCGNGELATKRIGADLHLSRSVRADELLDGLGLLLRGRSARQRRGLLHRSGLELDPCNRSVFCNGRTCRLPDGLFDLLYLLAACWPDSMDRGAIAARIVPDGRSREVDVRASRLRARLEEAFGFDLIKSVPGIGYRLNLPSPAKLQ